MSSNKLGVSSPSGTQTVGFYKLIHKLWSFTAVYIYFGFREEGRESNVRRRPEEL